MLQIEGAERIEPLAGLAFAKLELTINTRRWIAFAQRLRSLVAPTCTDSGHDTSTASLFRIIGSYFFASSWASFGA
jgi:hypothetical protein